MNHYVYSGFHKLGEEPAGTSGKCVWHDLKTNRGALRRAQRIFPNGFRLYQFINFYDSSTFKEVTW